MNERLIKIREQEVQEKTDGLPTTLSYKIWEYVPDTEFVLGY